MLGAERRCHPVQHVLARAVVVDRATRAEVVEQPHARALHATVLQRGLDEGLHRALVRFVAPCGQPASRPRHDGRRLRRDQQARELEALYDRAVRHGVERVDHQALVDVYRYFKRLARITIVFYKLVHPEAALACQAAPVRDHLALDLVPARIVRLAVLPLVQRIVVILVLLAGVLQRFPHNRGQRAFVRIVLFCVVHKVECHFASRQVLQER
mmetsp:Transcript_1648/g.4358  ORF Transcript_1648/g.4358 Transcript_1648/m.4358 type:complete len:213 (-) Transcript_1648:9928-10566(-)